MSDRMNPLSFAELMKWIEREYHEYGTIFGQRDFYKAEEGRAFGFPGGKLETPFGPAAGPHTQLTQNIVAAYLNGSRFLELKTVQTLDGEDLPVSKPCILAEEEGYNVEWSTELYVEQAFEEYVKAWFILHVLARELGLGAPDGFLFNMSVGYDLAGIKSQKIDRFIEGLKDASTTMIYRRCREYLRKRIDNFRYFNLEDLEKISPQICSSITLSTLHGCPASEIEKIASYLIEEKGLHTFIKCNPTLLGYEFARDTLAGLGYENVSFTDFHFKDDLQYEDAVPMMKRLQKLAGDRGLTFGVKLTNTFPVEIKAGELPGEEMYMSGAALFPLSISLAAKLSAEFDGKLPISYSGGADVRNIGAIVGAGILPVTLATTILKPGGYARLKQIAGALEKVSPETGGTVDTGAVRALAEDSKTNVIYAKSLKVKSRITEKTPIPPIDCFVSPCSQGCPIRQDIPAYLELVSEEKYDEALTLILEKNPLPFTTGTICPHNCMSACMRHFYESSVKIRDAKLLAAKNGYESVLSSLKPQENLHPKKIAIVGGGPAGIAAAYFLAKAGEEVELFVASETAGGLPMGVIPEFRIPTQAIQNDISFIEKLGVKIHTKHRIGDLSELQGYDRMILAIGAPVPGELKLEGDAPVGAITFLRDAKKTGAKAGIGSEVVVIGGGNTAMDTARAAIRTEGVGKVSLVYRRNRRYMSADEEELDAALEDGVIFRELLAPVKYTGNVLTCEEMELGEIDSSGRRSPVPTGRMVEIPADTVIAAVGERIDTEFYEKCGIRIGEKGLPDVDPLTMESNVANVYVIGDGRRGPATVVEAIADARACADHILGAPAARPQAQPHIAPSKLRGRKGVLKQPEGACDFDRCLACSVLCETCADVCPNRANVAVSVVGMEMPQIVHVDRLCNECGNCATFCPHGGAPYKEKLTLFETYGDMKDSANDGFCFTDQPESQIVLRMGNRLCRADSAADFIGLGIDPGVVRLIDAVRTSYPYLV